MSSCRYDPCSVWDVLTLNNGFLYLKFKFTLASCVLSGTLTLKSVSLIVKYVEMHIRSMTSLGFSKSSVTPFPQRTPLHLSGLQLKHPFPERRRYAIILHLLLSTGPLAAYFSFLGYKTRIKVTFHACIHLLSYSFIYLMSVCKLCKY